MGKYNGLTPEEVDTADTLEEANYLLGEYRLAFGDSWEMWIEASSRNNPVCQCRNNPRIVEIGRNEGGRPKPERCDICGGPTREGKNLCTKHIESAPYAKSLAARMLQLEEEEARAEKGDITFSASSENVKELLTLLELNGPRTIDRLSRELNTSKNVIRTYVSALQKEGIVKTKLTTRGATMVSLSNQ